MTKPLDRLRELFGGSPASKADASAPSPASALELPRERLRAALSLALGPGVARRLSEIGKGVFSDRSLRAVDLLEALLNDTSLTGQRFGSMLRELSSPDLLILATLLRDIEPGKTEDERMTAARAVCSGLGLAADSAHLVEFLVHDDLRMSKLAFRSDDDDPQAVEAFAAYLYNASLFNTFTMEEHLKMLTLMTLVMIDTDRALTPLKSELLWRLFVDTYNYLTKAYGDQLVDATAITRTALNANRPPSISQEELVQFLEGLPKRYLTLFDAVSIYEHVRVCRNVTAEDVHCFLKKLGGGVWELTVATLDKPFLFSNICGALSYLGMDILSGQAMTSSRGLAIDVFRFHDPGGELERAEPKPLLVNVIAGRVSVESLLQSRHAEAAAPPAEPVTPVIAFDNDASARYTIIEIVAQDAPGLLYRISRALSQFECEIENVVISTEERKAIDVFHVTKSGAKVPDSEELSLTEALEQALLNVAS
jgi:[protein-PII] uridylyltransferase